MYRDRCDPHLDGIRVAGAGPAGTAAGGPDNASLNAGVSNDLYLLRHGAVRRPGLQTYIGQLDLPLSPEGVQQAREWHRFFKNDPAERIVCSDLKRSLVTAEIIAGPFYERVSIHKELREIALGEWEGRSMDAVRRAFPDAWRRRGEHMDTFRPPGGESFRQLSDRVVPFVERLAAQTAAPVLIVGHAGVNRVILCHALGMPLKHLFRLGQDPGSLSCIDMKDGRWRVMAINRLPAEIIPAGRGSPGPSPVPSGA